MTKKYIENNLIRENGNLYWQKANTLDINTEELYLIYHETEIPKCVCSKNKPFISFSKGYRKTCGSELCIKASVQKSIKKTNLERYGVEHYFNNEKGKQTKLEKYGDPYYSNKEKAVKTCRDNNVYSKSYEKFKNNFTKEELKKHYEEVFKKVYKTKEEKYGNKFYYNTTKQSKNKRRTMEEKGLWVPLNSITDWEMYKRKVRKLTEETYNKFKDDINPSDYKRTLNGIEGYQLDHIISVKKGFLNSLSIHIIADKSNLQMLTWQHNRDKWM